MLELYKQLRALQEEFGGHIAFEVNDIAANLRWDKTTDDGRVMRFAYGIAPLQLMSGKVSLDELFRWFADGIRRTIANA